MSCSKLIHIVLQQLNGNCGIMKGEMQRKQVLIVRNWDE